MRVGTLNKLNAKGIKSAPDGMHSDGGGLFYQVRGNGRSWIFRFTWDGKKREMGLGSASSVTLAQARTMAAEARELVGQGINPRDDRTAAEPVPEPASKAVVTFQQAMHTYIQAHHQTWSNAKHSAQWESSLTRHAGPLLRRPVDQITTADIEDVLSPIWLSKCETASRVRQRIERILSACIARGDRPGPNPAALRDNLEHILPKQTKVRTVKHHAAVDVGAVPAAFAAIWAKRHKGIGYSGLVTLMLTACRSGEARHMQWGDWTDATIVIPAERMKARSAHRIPVTFPLAIWLSGVPRIAGTALVHPGTSGRAMSDMTMAKALRNAGYPDATPHGLRSSFSDWANQAGWPRELVEDQLAHQVGSSVERAYRRTDYLERRRPLMAAWARYLVSAL